jgi:hypothetical protein
MAPDASPNLRVWQMFDEAAAFDQKLEGARELLSEFEHATDGKATLAQRSSLVVECVS